MRIQQVVIEGLGHISTVLIDDDAGVAAVVDPRRDIDVYIAAARERDVRITDVVETHLHNDYVSGARELAALTGATHRIGAGAELRYDHSAVRHGDTWDVGSLRFTALETPGHTPEHVSYAVADTARADEPVLLLTGGSLLVGAVGRTDLLGADRAVSYAHDMHRSIHDVLLRHEDFVGVLPTHGAGSLCSTGIASTPTSTIGFERRHNRLVQPMEVDAFARALLAGQPTVPRYFARMRPINQAGPTPVGAAIAPSRPLRLEDVRAAMDAGAVVVDARRPAAWAAAHVPGAISIPAGTSFGTWLGWVVAHDRPTVLVLDRPEDANDLQRQALRIGHEGLAGHLRGGFAAWTDAGLPIESADQLTVDDLAASLGADDAERPFVLDVRQATEFDEGHVPGARHITAGSLPDELSMLPRDRPIAVMCASGYRAAVATSLLGAAGFQRVSWVADGVPAWDAAGYGVERGGDVGDAVPGAAPEGAGDHRH